MGPFEGEVELPLALLEYSVSSAATCFCLPLFGTFPGSNGNVAALHLLI